MSFFALGPQLDDQYPLQRQEGAIKALRLLSAINLLNYADRYVLSAVKSDVQTDLNLNDFQSSIIANN